MKKRWVFVPLSMLLLVLAITGGAVLAFDPDRDADFTGESFAARVATILGLELTEVQVQAAFRQARREKQDERYRERLHRQVEQGLITDDDAEANYVWFEGRPDTFTRGFSRFGGRRAHFGSKHAMEGHQ